MNDIEQRIRALPKWAQQHIGSLENRIDSLRHSLGEMKSAAKPTSTFYSVGTYGESAGRHYIPEHTDVVFSLSGPIALDDSEFTGDTIRVRVNQQKELEVMSTNARIVQVIPQSANTFRVRTSDK